MLTTENNYLFTGEQFDKNLNQYYLRARYYNQNIGRFSQQDTYAGNAQDPITLHKYLYANADGVNKIDPSGNMSLGEIGASLNIQGTLRSISPSLARGAVQLARNAKIFDIYDYVSWPLHFYMYAERNTSRSGIRYDVGNRFGWGGLIREQICKGNVCGIVPGVISASGASRSALKGKGVKIVSLTFSQWMVWHSTVVGSEQEECQIPITYGFVPGTQNCLSWTVAASAKALLISRMVK